MNFENLSQTWQQQNYSASSTTAQNLIDQAKAKSSDFKRNQVITTSVLAITFLILVGFYTWVEAYQDFTQTLGLSLMILMLFIRIVLEIMSKYQLRKIDNTINFESFVQKHNSYFKNRQWIHFVFTPIIYLLYVGGFVSMLPVFQQNLSEGFYLYILVSGMLTFIVLGIFIVFHIWKEYKQLKFLKAILES